MANDAGQTMIKINENYRELQASYLFSDIAKRVAAHQRDNPDQQIIKLGIGDVTRALPAACIQAFHQAVDEMASDSSFHGYGPEQGYDFLRQVIAREDFQARGADIDADEVFVSDGAKCDSGNFQEIFATDIRVAIPDPVYPVYIDTNVMAALRKEPERRDATADCLILSTASTMALSAVSAPTESSEPGRLLLIEAGKHTMGIL